MKVIWPALLVFAMCAASAMVGYQYLDRQYQAELKIAKDNFDKRVKEANEAYAGQKVIDDQELEALRQQATTAPANPTIAIKKDMAKRIGAIR